ncbi:hypothetical protein M8C21_027366 [Ambrosia artemisiifolia]|uniref:Response regulatory domain-containing protein n=1 Tax=Ambrosia artemisiifolia TaxID=4212 RepID=A0AAD5CSH0_AMBAR|nr:hypothetical protein M8C21_026603 [Ambrosia artemisiifolia]KAI7754475.1 hypothetical protein M8C21_027366 [Ambrosia artemisiifolia]
MVCTANDLLEWKDFPKGLRVLLLDDDINSATQIRLKLEEMDYVVSMFYCENEALSALSDETQSFHVAIVEVKEDNKDGRFKFLENTKDLPTIMTSEVNCISIMMKCIALGAVEFLEKPLSEDKLRNIWQHVAHKAFNAGTKEQTEPSKSDLDIHLKKEDIKEEFSQNHEHNYEMWAPPYYPAWQQSSENWMWNPYPGLQAEAWGCPTVPPPQASFPHQNASQFQSRGSMQNRQTMEKNSFDNYPGDEVIDKVVKEAINKPWLPLPLGLKPPSTESVISELSKQGISTVPPEINGSR